MKYNDKQNDENTNYKYPSSIVTTTWKDVKRREIRKKLISFNISLLQKLSRFLCHKNIRKKSITEMYRDVIYYKDLHVTMCVVVA